MRAGAARPGPRVPRRDDRLAAAAAGLAVLVILGPLAGAAATMPDLPSSLPSPVSSAPAPLSATAAAESLLARGELSLSRGEADLALHCYREALGVPALRGRALYGEARAWLALGDGDRACRLLRELGAARDPADTTAAGRNLTAAVAELLGQTYLQLGRGDAARGVFLDLARSFPDRRDWAAVMIGRSYQNEAAWRRAFAAIRPVLRQGSYAPAYDLALALYWKLDAGTQRELAALLQGYLGASGRDFAGGGR